ncbi:MAG: glycine--tRNA ligase subunit beta [Spirochaetes bacterium GWF1_51_8]|nr:MAG: glycine--tRNA ligase subunit beta [Spirochaetes bacterium GWF1_51_8]
MSKNLLLELGVEEIPHGILTDTIRQLKEITIEKLKGAGIEFGKIFVYGTPRRLAVQLTDVEELTASRSVEKKGPDWNNAFDKDGKPTKALEGFLAGNKAKLGEIEKRDLKGSFYVFLTKNEGGEMTESLLPKLLKGVILSLSFPKAMRWANFQTAFVRPIRWIVCLFNKDIIDFSIENIRSGNTSYGHRLLHNEGFTINNALDYKQALKEQNVFADNDQRKEMILDMIEKTAERLNTKPVLTNELVDTLVNLTEYPQIAVGKFEEEFLSLPPEVLISEMIDHQMFVPLRDVDGDLVNNFIITANIKPNNNVIEGNERVIRARFKDGKFFWEEDRKRKFDEYVDGLKNVTFAKGLGSLYQKAERMQRLVTYIAPKIGYQDSTENALRAAYLCKADLVTSMVNEFDELQGTMGYYYALNSGEKKEVAVSVREHYLPKFSGDSLPSLKEGILVSLADRIDNLFALYAQGRYVTGSKDPYALRRQTLGIIRILIEKEIHLDWGKLFEEILPLYHEFLAVDKSDFKKELLSFITTRIKTVFKEYEFAYDEIEAGILNDVSDIYDSYLRIKAIHEARKTEDFTNLAVAFKRVKNIIRGHKNIGVKDGLLKEEAEKILFEAYSKSEKVFTDTLNKKDYKNSVMILTSFREPVDRFFDDVLVMDKDEALKDNRIALLGGIDGLFMQFIDFEKLVVE